MSLDDFNKKSIYLQFNIFIDFVTNQDGAVISLTSNALTLVTISNIYKSCVANGESKGGCIYFASGKELIVKNSCVYKCNSYQGVFYYITCLGNTLSYSHLNETSTTKCSGSNEGVCSNFKSNLLSSNYNSSYCQLASCNVHSWSNEKSDSSFYQFYENSIDILYGVNADSKENKISFANLISNHKSDGKYGFFHLHPTSNSGELHLNNIYAIYNTWTLINCLAGKIVIESMTCDNYDYRDIFVDTSNVIINKTITLSFLFVIETRFCNCDQKFKASLCSPSFNMKNQKSTQLLLFVILFICIQ